MRFVVENRGPEVVSDVLKFVQPLPKGVYHDLPTFSVGGLVVQAAPIFSKWRDDTHRFALLHVPMSVSGDRMELDISVNASAVLVPFRWWPGFARLGQIAPLIGMQIGTGGHPTWFSGAAQVLEEGHVVRRGRWTITVPNSPVWAELTVEALTERSWVRWWLRYGMSDPGDPTVRRSLDDIWLVTSNAHAEVRNAADKVLEARTDGTRRMLKLCARGTWQTDESQACRGLLAFPGSDISNVQRLTLNPLLGVSLDWEESQAFSPYGFLAKLPGEAEAASVARSNQEFTAQAKGPWGQHPSLAQANNEDPSDDLSPVALLDCAHGVNLPRLLVIERAMHQLACKPIYVRNADGTPHDLFSPKLVIWDDMIHKTSLEQVGKPAGTDRPQPSPHGWNGSDKEHDQLVHLCTLAMLTGDPLLVDMVEQHGRLREQVLRTDTINPVVNNLGASRGEGRSIHVATFCDLLWNGSVPSVLEQRIRQRFVMLGKQWAGRSTSPVRPLHVVWANPEDTRIFGGKLSYWKPWEEAIFVGMAAMAVDYYEIEPATELLWQVGRSLVLYGISLTPSGWDVHNAVEWQNGAFDSPQVELAGGTFDTWAIPAVKWITKKAVGRDTAVADKGSAFLTAMIERPFSWTNFEFSATP